MTADEGFDGNPILISGERTSGTIFMEGSFDRTVGVMAHEFGHALGLPDLYDVCYDNPAEDSAGIGHWGLMGWGANGWDFNSGPVAFSAWSLAQLGWLGDNNERLVDITDDTEDLLVEDFHVGGNIYRIMLGLPPNRIGQYHQEYLLLEQRTRTYYNQGIPAEGLLVWHVSPMHKSNKDEANKIVDLITADGLYADGNGARGDNLDFWAHDAAYSNSRGGNRGDSTDLFDGVRYKTLNATTNPSTAEMGTVSSALQPVQLTFEPQGKGMLVDITQPRWAGTIEEEVHWTGVVRVDGDLLVGPQANLVIMGDTEVLFAEHDLLQSGRDPELVELQIEGGFARDGDAIFRSVGLDDSWYGIVVTSTASTEIQAPLTTYRLTNSVNGIVWPDVSATREGEMSTRVTVGDAAGAETAGNGDGRLNPGESFRLDLEVRNWTLTLLKNARLRVRWHTPFLERTWARTQVEGNEVWSEGRFNLGGGEVASAQLPTLTLNAGAGSDPIDLIVEVNSTRGVLLDTLRLEVEGPNPTYRAQLETGSAGGDEAVIVTAGGLASFGAQIEGDVESAYLVLRSLTNRSAATADLTIADDNGSRGHVFDAQLPPIPDQYQARLRLHGRDGSVTFSDQQLYVWADDTPTPAPVLVLLGERYNDAAIAELRSVLTDELAELGLEARFLETAPSEGAIYRTLLPHYARPDRMVLWLGSGLDEMAQAAFRDLLEGGGRVLFASYSLSWRLRNSDFMREVLHAEPKYSVGKTTHHTIRSVGLEEELEFNTLHYPHKAIPPARPILRNSLDRDAGLYVDDGTSRVVYLPFRLNSQISDQIRPLLRGGMRFLSETAEEFVTAVEMEPQSVPVAPSLSNYPNPFNAATNIVYSLARESGVSLNLYNAAGQRIRVLVSGARQSAGEHTALWDGLDDAGRSVSSGVYFYTLVTEGRELRRRLLLLR